ncbi:hypothetical protein OAO89_03535 [Pelagibacteraceae bacterium]|nr:hypothetical protein [Pelagibacteraceae bacterium]
MRFFLAILLSVILHASFLQATEPTYKFTFGTSIGNIPIEINRMNKNEKNIGGIKINTWTLSPNFSALGKDKKALNFEQSEIKENFYIKINFRF